MCYETLPSVTILQPDAEGPEDPGRQDAHSKVSVGRC